MLGGVDESNGASCTNEEQAMSKRLLTSLAFIAALVVAIGLNVPMSAASKAQIGAALPEFDLAADSSGRNKKQRVTGAVNFVPNRRAVRARELWH